MTWFLYSRLTASFKTLPYVLFHIWLLSLSKMFLSFLVFLLYSFLLLNRISMSEHTTVCLSIYPLTDIWVFPIWSYYEQSSMTIRTQVICGHRFSFLLGKSLGTELLSHMVSICLTFEKLTNFFQSGCTILCFYEQHMSLSVTLYACQHLILPIFFILANLLQVEFVHFLCT